MFMNFEEIDLRNKALYLDKFENLSKYKITIIGLGGVGSIIPLSLVRVGIKKLILIDKDKVELSNLNRQIAYDINDVNKLKVDALKEKLVKLREENSLDISIYPSKIDDDFNSNILGDSDYIIDAIDDIKAKIKLIKYALTNNKKIISSLGMGKRIDTSKIEITSLNKTHDDPLAKKLRYLLKKEGINELNKIMCAFSFEVIDKSKFIDNNVIASSVFVPNVAGLSIANYVINDLLK